MPVRVRCPQCEKVVNAPDAARGKAVKCPECESRIPVPAGDAEPGAAKPSRPARPAEKAEARPKSSKSESTKSSTKPAAVKKKPVDDDDDFLAKLDLKRAEDRNAKVCPKCGHEVDEEDIECPACGIDLQTGGLGKAARKARMKGPDPADFYATAWKEGAAFVKANFGLAISSWTKLLILTFITWLMGVGGIFFLLNDHKPSFWFFRVLAWVLTAGMFGWFFHVSEKAIQFALEKKDVLDRTPYDSFTSMALGISWAIWSVAAAAPLAIITLPIYFMIQDNDALRYGLIAGISLAGIIPIVPIVMAHRSMPVNWMIWVSPLMWKTAFRTIGGVMFCCMVAFVTFLPVAGLIAGDIFLGRGIFYPVIEAWGIKHDAWTDDVILGFAEFYSIVLFGQSSSGATSGVMSGVYLVLWMLLKATMLFAMTIWAIFMIRVVALFTFYNKKRLELIGEVKQKKYVAKERKIGEDGEVIEEGMSPVMKWLVGTLGTVFFYTIVNVILYVSGAGFLLMPKWMAAILRLTNGE